ncbi:MAG: flagellar filament capping protein FliD, partial [Candidatus Gastranaerophilaceae bacterium]
MPTITFSGLGSGLDTSSWVEALVSVKQVSVTAIESKLQAVKDKQGTVSKLQASFSSLRTAIEKLTDAKFGSALDLFANNNAKSSNEDIFTAVATKEAARQNYDIKVEHLATKTSAASEKPVGAVANDNTKLSSLGIKEGSLTLYVNGIKNTINISEDDTVQDFKTRLSSAGVKAEIDTNGILNITTVDPSDKLLIGATNDTSNIKSLLGLTQQEDGSYTSTAAMYSVTTASKILDADIFSTGEFDADGNPINTSVKAGTFTIGDAEFTIDENTTISSLISEINSNDKAGVTANWDSANSKLVLTSNVEGQSYINVEAGTSNFTDVMGLTTSTWNSDGTVATTALNTDAQSLGDNAILYVNGTQVISSSNTVTSDISRLNGVTLTLKGVNTEETGATSLDISQDTSAIESALDKFVEEYNSLMTTLDELTATDGDLYGDTTINSIKQSLRRLVTSATGNEDDTYKMLSQIGVSTASAGASISADTNTISLDKDVLRKALAEDSDAVKKVLMGTSSNQDGILSQMESIIEETVSATGYFSTTNKSINSQISRYNTKIDRANLQVETYKSNLEAKFQAMEDT